MATQQDALRMALDFNKIRCAVMMECDSSQPTAAYIDAAIRSTIDAYESALAEQDDEAVTKLETTINEQQQEIARLQNQLDEARKDVGKWHKVSFAIEEAINNGMCNYEIEDAYIAPPDLGE